MATLRVVTEAQAKTCIDLPTARQAVKDAYIALGKSTEIQSRPPIMVIAGPRPTLGRAELGQFRIKGASVPSRGAAGAFLATRDFPYIYLWSLDTDEPIGLIASDWLSQFRVGVTILVAIEMLATATIRKIAFFGTGKYAVEACQLLTQQLPETELHVLASNLANAKAFASYITGPVIASDNPQRAVQDADVVVTLTNSKAPFLRGDWLKPGALVLSMGSAHEADISVLHAIDALIVDDFAYALVQGNIGAWIRRGDISQEGIANRIRANIGEVVAGIKIGRKDPDERILAIIQGLTACDIAMAKAVLDRANLRSTGQTVEI